MKALLLAAGLGTRLYPVTKSIPKCLVDINGRPLLDYWMEMLTKAGISKALINLHYLPDLVRQYLEGCRYPIEVTQVYEEDLLNTAGTLFKNRDFFAGGPVMLIHADNLSIFDPSLFIDKFNKRGPGIEITMMTFCTDNPAQCGIVELDRNETVVAFHEKKQNPPGNLANGAVYILSEKVIDFMHSLNKERIDFSVDVVPNFIGRINTFKNDIYHRDIGSIASLEIARKDFSRINMTKKFS
jgi:mannose-1-phosphate guanylyltransferase